MSNRNPIQQNGAQGFSSPNVRRDNSIPSTTLIAAAAFLAMSLFPMSSAQASANASLLDAQRVSISEAQSSRAAVESGYTVLAIIATPDKDPPDGGDGDKPKRPPVEKRAVVSVHG